MILSRKSSESRYDVTYKLMKTVKEPEDLLRILGNTDNKNTQMNPFRTSETHVKVYFNYLKVRYYQYQVIEYFDYRPVST